MPGLAYKIGEGLVILEALHVFLITYLQVLCYSVQTVEHSSIYRRRTKRQQSSASNVATSNQYPVLAVITCSMVETELVRNSLRRHRNRYPIERRRLSVGTEAEAEKQDTD